MADGQDPQDPTPPAAPERQPGMPRWVKVSLVVVAALVVLLLVAQAIGLGGDHGPGRHEGSDTPTSVADKNGGHRSPVDHGP